MTSCYNSREKHCKMYIANHCRNTTPRYSKHPDGVSGRPSCVEQPKGHDAWVFCLSDSLANIGPTCLVVKCRECEDVLIDFTSEQKLSDDIGRSWKIPSNVWFVLICENHSTSQMVNPGHTSRQPKKHANNANHFPCHLLWQLGSKAGC